MIFARRALQARLNALRLVLTETQVKSLAARLNKPGADRVAAMWEVAVLDALSGCGTLQSEKPLASGRRPDISFETDGFTMIADITAVSDEGLDEANPYQELSQLIEQAKTRLGLPIGGVDLRVHSRNEETKRGRRTFLLLPPRPRLQEFVRNEIVPEIQRQRAAGEKLIRIGLKRDNIGLDLTINPAGSPHSSGSYAAYNVPKTKDRNPLYNALRSKAKQLEGAQGIVGVIVGDGDSATLSGRGVGWDAVSLDAIVQEFFRQFSTVNFVLVLSVREERDRWPAPPTRDRRNHLQLFTRPNDPHRGRLERLFTEVARKLPRPLMMPVNGALRARESGYDLGHHGGYDLCGNRIRMSLREMTETLAGIRTLADNGARNIEAARRQPQKPNQVQEVIRRNLREGRLPVNVEIIRTGDDDSDDWIEFEFGPPDPAISSLR